MLVADGDLTKKQIAAKCRVTPYMIAKWMRREDFMAQVERFRVEVRATVLREGIARLEIRMRALNRRFYSFEKIIDDRAADPAMQHIPGGDTGLLKSKIRKIGSGANTIIYDLGEVDHTLLRESLAIMEQARKEMEGDFEKAEPKRALNERPNVKLHFPVMTEEDKKPIEVPTLEMLRRFKRSGEGEPSN